MTVNPSSLRRFVASSLCLRLGMRLIRGISREKVAGIESAQRDGPIRSIRNLAARRDISRDTLIRLAAADAFRSLGLSRRAALWEILALDENPGPLFADLVPDEAPAVLPTTPLDEAVVQDYDTFGLSLTAHPIGLIRADLAARGVRPAAELAIAKNKQRIAVAGLVTHRQRPGTAKGIVFITIEDETGHANLIVRPRIWERDHRIARTKVAFIAEGVVERQGEVIHLLANRIRDISATLAPVRVTSRDFH